MCICICISMYIYHTLEEYQESIIIINFDFYLKSLKWTNAILKYCILHYFDQECFK